MQVSTTMNKASKIIIWVLVSLLAALFLLSAVPKFIDEGWIHRFASWGYSEIFLYIIATLEALGAIGLLMPKTSPWAAAGLIGIMIGAIYIHLTHDQGIWWNIAYITLLSIVGIYRWKERAAQNLTAA